MSWLIGILATAFGISLLVIVHECGHYFAARAFGMRVTRFSIGLGPVIAKFQPKGSPTIFQVCAIPVLAYVQVDGMNPFEDIDKTDPALFPNKGVFARIVTIFGGSFANYLCASVLMFGLVFFGGIPVFHVAVERLVEGTPAASSTLHAGDVFLSVNGRRIRDNEDLVQVTRARAGQPTIYRVRRESGQTEDVTITPSSAGQIGVGLNMAVERYRTSNLGEAFKYAVTVPVLGTMAQVQGIIQQFQRRTTEGLVGPVGITREVARSVSEGWRSYMDRLIMISIALGFFNLLPFPALDGGRLIFLFFELITRRKPNEKMEAAVHAAGLLVLLGVILLVSFRDVGRSSQPTPATQTATPDAGTAPQNTPGPR